MKILPVAAALLAGAFAAGAQEQQFHFSNVDTPASITDVINAIRTIGSLQNVGYDAATKTVTVQGSANDIAVAAWIFQQLDQTVNRQSQQFQVPGGPDVIGLFYLAHGDAPRDLNGDANAVRTILELTRVFPFAATHALLVRAAPSSIQYTSWLLSNIDLAENPRTSSPGATVSSDLAYGNMGESVRVLYLQPNDTYQQLMDATNAVRVIPELVHVFACDTLRAIVVRATADRLATATWLAAEIDSAGATAEAAPLIYRMQQPVSPVVLFVPLANPAPGAAQKLAEDVRTDLQITRVFSATKAVVVRGTEDEVARAQKLVADLQPGK